MIRFIPARSRSRVEHRTWLENLKIEAASHENSSPIPKLVGNLGHNPKDLRTGRILPLPEVGWKTKPVIGWKSSEVNWKWLRYQLEMSARSRLEGEPKLGGNFPEVGWKKGIYNLFSFSGLQIPIVLSCLHRSCLL